MFAKCVHLTMMPCVQHCNQTVTRSYFWTIIHAALVWVGNHAPPALLFPRNVYIHTFLVHTENQIKQKFLVVVQIIETLEASAVPSSTLVQCIGVAVEIRTSLLSSRLEVHPRLHWPDALCSVQGYHEETNRWMRRFVLNVPVYGQDPELDYKI